MKKLLPCLLLLTFACGEPPATEKETEQTIIIDSLAYEVITTTHAPMVENYHILVKTPNTSKDSLQAFANRFRRANCGQCNINLYDSKEVAPLITKKPLEGTDYLTLADHYIAASSFDVQEINLYPYQDLKYKELGGKNFKK